MIVVSGILFTLSVSSLGIVAGEKLSLRTLQTEGRTQSGVSVSLLGSRSSLQGHELNAGHLSTNTALSPQSERNLFAQLYLDNPASNMALNQISTQIWTSWRVYATLVVLSFAVIYVFSLSKSRASTVPVSVNYHLTRQCNKTCGFCFHTAKTSHRLSPNQAKKGLLLLKNAGMRKINFAGGEPFLYKKFLGEMIDFCKEHLKIESVSIVSNGSLVTREFLDQHGTNIDILAISCDSFDEQTNISIGRGSGDQIPRLYQISEWCRLYGVKFKINTVVCRLNFLEDMNKQISRLQPFRWKCFQVLMVAGENDSDKTLRDVRKYTISDSEYQEFCLRHQAQPSFVAEPNNLMAKSYLILDEYMRFLDRDGRQPSKPIMEVGVQRALDDVFWDENGFRERGGFYDWSREKTETCSTSMDGRLEW
jgi:radical S-adenosyl methionine domain-containing protein 2